MKDMHLERLTGDQALTILRRMADMVVNGLEPWGSTGHDSADSLACTLLGINETAVRDSVRVRREDGVEATDETVWARGMQVGNDIFAAGRTDAA